MGHPVHNAWPSPECCEVFDSPCYYVLQDARTVKLVIGYGYWGKKKHVVAWREWFPQCRRLLVGPSHPFGRGGTSDAVSGPYSNPT